MSGPQSYEVLVLGSGAGSKLLAWHLANAGRRTAVVERKWIGGSCPNVNCLPSKNEIWSARVADLIHHAGKFGMVTGPTKIDMGHVRQLKRDMVDGLVAMHLEKHRASSAELVMGAGRFVAPKTLELRLNDGGTRVLTSDRVFLNLGTHGTIPPIPGLAEAGPITNIELLELDRLPEHLVVLSGAGANDQLRRCAAGAVADQELRSRHLPDHVFEHLLTMARLHAAKSYDRLTHDVEAITGRPATSVRDFVARHAEIFGSKSQPRNGTRPS